MLYYIGEPSETTDSHTLLSPAR